MADLANWQAAAQATQQVSDATARLTQSTALDNAQATEEEAQSDATTAKDDAQDQAEETQTDTQAQAADAEALAQAAVTDAVFTLLPDALIVPLDGPAPALAPDYLWGYEANDYYLYPTFGTFSFGGVEAIGYEGIATVAPTFGSVITDYILQTGDLRGIGDAAGAGFGIYNTYAPHDIVRTLLPLAADS